MRRLAVGALVAMICGGGAFAAVRTVPAVHSATAAYSSNHQSAIVVRATVDLPDMCWSHPRLQAPAPGVQPDADGVAEITAVADYSGGAGMACAMIFRPSVKTPALYWKTYPRHGLKAVRVVGAATPVVAVVSPAP